MISIYRYVSYFPTTTYVPTLPFISFSMAHDLRTLPTISMDGVETLWKETNDFTVVLHYGELDAYYFLLPADTYLPESSAYRLMKPDVAFDPEDHHCDYYAKPLLARFADRLSRRLTTRAVLASFYASIRAEKNTVLYHEQLLRNLKTFPWGDTHDRHLVQNLQDESRDIVETERHYRPDGMGYQEVKEEFETRACSSAMLGRGI